VSWRAAEGMFLRKGAEKHFAWSVQHGMRRARLVKNTDLFRCERAADVKCESGGVVVRRWIRLFILPFCVGLAAGQTARVDQPITLENSELRVALSPQNATLVSVERKQSKASYLGSSKQAGWFRIQLPLPYWEGHAAASRDLKAVTVQRRGPDAVEFQTTQLASKEGRYSISAKLLLRLEGDNLVCKLSLQNQSKIMIDRIIFPVVDVPSAADSNEILAMPHAVFPLRAAFSGNEVRTDPNPFDLLDLLDVKAWFSSDPKISIKAFNYPNILPTAWFTFTGDGKGIGFDVHDHLFQFQKFLIERRLYRDVSSPEANRRDYELSWNWYPLVRPGASWESPEVYIKFDNGDWHGIAGQHRDWLRSRVHHPNIAKKFQSSIGWLSRSVRSYDEIPAIAQQGVEVGAPYFIIYGWAGIGAAGYLFSAYPRADLGGIESLQRNLLKARELGSHPLAWTNRTISVETDLGHQAQAKDWVALDRWGGGTLGGQWSLFEPFMLATVPNNEQWLELDPAGAKDYQAESIRRFVQDYHFSGFEMDQANKYYLSYRDPSKYPPELAFAQGYADFYARVMDIVKKEDPDGIIVGENVSDFMAQYVDSLWIFEGGALNVPLHSMIRYCLPWVTVPARAVVTDLGHANQAFMLNAPLDIFEDLAQHPDYAKHLKRLHALKKATTHYFYQGQFSDGEGFTLQGAAPVMAKSYRELAGKFLAVVVVNTTGTTQQTTLKPAADIASRDIRHYYLDGRTEAQKPASEIRLELPAFDVQVLAFELP